AADGCPRIGEEREPRRYVELGSRLGELHEVALGQREAVVAGSYVGVYVRGAATAGDERRCASLQIRARVLLFARDADADRDRPGTVGIVRRLRAERVPNLRGELHVPSRARLTLERRRDLGDARLVEIRRRHVRHVLARSLVESLEQAARLDALPRA